MSDAELAARAAGGNEAAFHTLYHRHRDAVWGFAWVLTGSRYEAEDLLQECFLVFIRKAAAFDPARAQLRTWLFSVMRNLHHQHRRRKGIIDSEAPEVAAPDPNMEEVLIRGETSEAVRAAVASLPDTQREAVFLFEFEGLSIKETASILQIEPNAVKVRLHRGRERLKQLLAHLKPECAGEKDRGT
jgi:RNA polymerase sigma-70 factor (ECF subfamily)